MELFITILALVYGAVMGSFLNCAAYRISRGESFVTGHSRCTACGHVLGPVDLVPVFSWLLLGGKCRYCGEKISARYPAAELFWALVTALCVWRFGLRILFIRNYIFLCCLFCLSLVDMETMTIPDGCHLISAGAWAVTLPWSGMGSGEIISHVMAGLLFGAGLLLNTVCTDFRLYPGPCGIRDKAKTGQGDGRISLRTVHFGGSRMHASVRGADCTVVSGTAESVREENDYGENDAGHRYRSR